MGLDALPDAEDTYAVGRAPSCSWPTGTSGCGPWADADDEGCDFSTYVLPATPAFPFCPAAALQPKQVDGDTIDDKTVEDDDDDSYTDAEFDGDLLDIGSDGSAPQFGIENDVASSDGDVSAHALRRARLQALEEAVGAQLEATTCCTLKVLFFGWVVGAKMERAGVG